MPLRLVYHGSTNVPIEVEGFVPRAVREMSLAEIERFEIFHGNEKRPVADFFSLSGSGGDGHWELDGDLSGVHEIGAGMSEGTIRVAGPVGRHLGSEMTGGEIHVAGSAGDWVGAEMHGGLIHVHGDAGNLAGAAYRGSRRGMTGGTLLIGGNAGHEIGHTMRRGLLAVGGSCGDFAGISMIAGTILVFGASGMRAGAGMRRGTLALLGHPAPTLLPTFRAGSTDKPLIMQLLLRHLRQLDFPVPDSALHAAYRMYHGDMLALGRGEILVPETAMA